MSTAASPCAAAARGRGVRALLAAMIAGLACAPGAGRNSAPRAPAADAVVRESRDGAVARGGGTPDAGGRLVRVALTRGAAAAGVTGTGDWRLYDDATRTLLARARAGDAWSIEGDGRRLRAVGPGGATPWRVGPIVARSGALGALVVHDGKPYRGELWLHSTPAGGVTIVNRVGVEDYLRGVVPLELGTDGASDLAALQAQAVAARSYAFAHLPEWLPADDAQRQAALPWDLQAGVSDQVYGGADVEKPGSDRAVRATTGLVLRWNGSVVTAPYHSTCGGNTAEPREVWKGTGEPWLRRVSDRVPGTLDRYYCEAAPRYRWTREFDAEALSQTIGRYLKTYAPGAPTEAGAVRSLVVEERTPSGRVAALGVRTDAGTFVLRGSGNGHGIGMCQWGAIGRARAGQDFRTILRTY